MRIRNIIVSLQTAETAGNRTLLYGQALLLRHAHSNMVGPSDSARKLQCVLIGCCIWSDTAVPVECFVLFQYLSCLTSSGLSADKLAFDVGLQEDVAGKNRA